VDQGMRQRPSLAALSKTQTLTGVLPTGIPKVCSVPLIEMQIPKVVHFTMRLAPPKETIDRGQVAVPAPACP